MNLSDIYEEEGIEALKKLAKETGADLQYLRQCATNWKNKRPSPDLAAKLIQADPRITWDDLYEKEIQTASDVAAA